MPSKLGIAGGLNALGNSVVDKLPVVGLTKLGKGAVLNANPVVTGAVSLADAFTVGRLVVFPSRLGIAGGLKALGNSVVDKLPVVGLTKLGNGATFNVLPVAPLSAEAVVRPIVAGSLSLAAAFTVGRLVLPPSKLGIAGGLKALGNSVVDKLPVVGLIKLGNGATFNVLPVEPLSAEAVDKPADTDEPATALTVGRLVLPPSKLGIAGGLKALGNSVVDKLPVVGLTKLGKGATFNVLSPELPVAEGVDVVLVVTEPVKLGKDGLLRIPPSGLDNPPAPVATSALFVPVEPRLNSLIRFTSKVSTSSGNFRKEDAGAVCIDPDGLARFLTKSAVLANNVFTVS
ncbi:MAG: hypothetical protein V3U78_05825 [Thiotrichaceae bacterium]